MTITGTQNTKGRLVGENVTIFLLKNEKFPLSRPKAQNRTHQDFWGAFNIVLCLPPPKLTYYIKYGIYIYRSLYVLLLLCTVLYDFFVLADTILLRIPSLTYLSTMLLGSGCDVSIKFFARGKLVDSGQLYFIQQSFCFCKPEIDIQVCTVHYCMYTI